MYLKDDRTTREVLSSTLWHILSQEWFPQDNWRPQARPQVIFELDSWQGQSVISWPPTHSTGTFTSHFGCGNFLISYLSDWISHGPAGLKSLFTTTFTASWHLAVQRCVQLVVSFISKHCSKHGGHSPKWHLCRSFGWWHMDDNLHGLWHFGGLVFFSRPHGTSVVVMPQLLKKKNLPDLKLLIHARDCFDSDLFFYNNFQTIWISYYTHHMEVFLLFLF